LTFQPLSLGSAPTHRATRPALIPEDCHGQSRIAEDQARVERRHRLLLCHQEKLAHHDRQAGEEEIRPDRQEARRVPRGEDQVSVLVIPDARSAIRDPDAIDVMPGPVPGHFYLVNLSTHIADAATKEEIPTSMAENYLGQASEHL